MFRNAFVILPPNPFAFGRPPLSKTLPTPFAFSHPSQHTVTRPKRSSPCHYRRRVFYFPTDQPSTQLLPVKPTYEIAGPIGACTWGGEAQIDPICTGLLPMKECATYHNLR